MTSITWMEVVWDRIGSYSPVASVRAFERVRESD